MEPPSSCDSEALRNERVKVFRSIKSLNKDDVVRGQFRGYHDEDGVAPGSQVETFAAARLHIDSWRWQGVPFYVRTGKCMPVTATEVLIELHRPPQTVFGEIEPMQSNYFRFLLSPDVMIATGARAKLPGERMAGEKVELVVCRRTSGQMGPYERLLGDVMKGDATLFARQDGVEEAWRIVEPILGASTPIHPYEQNTWGPSEADRMISRVGGWHCPRATA